MLNGDIFTNPILFALQETMKRFENSENEDDKCIYELLKRSNALWSNIKIYGLETVGMTYEEFCEQLETKKNIIFISDDALEISIKHYRL